jgi:hypothetical protein
MDPVEKLLAIEEIKVLKARYLQYVDLKDWDALAGVFTDDAFIDYRGEPQNHVGHGIDESMLNPDDWVFTGGEPVA